MRGLSRGSQVAGTVSVCGGGGGERGVRRGAAVGASAVLGLVYGAVPLAASSRPDSRPAHFLFFIFSRSHGSSPATPPPLRITRTPLSLCPFPLSSAGSGGIGWCQGVRRCGRWGRQSAPFPPPSPPLPPSVPTSWPACSLPHCPIRRDTASTGAADQATGGGKGESRRGFLPPPSFAVPAAPTSAAVTASRPLRIVTPALKK